MQAVKEVDLISLLNYIQNLLKLTVLMRHLNIIVKYLIKEGYDPSCLDNSYNNILAAFKGHLSVVKYLTVCDPMSRNINRNSHLHLAARKGHVEIIQFLISKMDHTQGNGGLNTLHAAVTGGNLGIVQHLIEKN